ncbi:hypothetical protein OK024_07870 [Acinetobacter sp. UGAL515B_02]|nr:hypothetical protein [Acinetobacter sp. UGAL515B_02]WON81496.1 hypothetical protein OK024_07870 [Acinetobacter sp. UGAL515B_02]
MTNLTEVQNEDNQETLVSDAVVSINPIEPDGVDDFEYHISPNCKVIRFDSWDEALHFHRAFHAQKEVP